MARFDLSDEEWAIIAPLLPEQGRGARRGAAAVASGGKFANGAITAAFAQLYNAEVRRDISDPCNGLTEACGGGIGSIGAAGAGAGAGLAIGNLLGDTIISIRDSIGELFSGPTIHTAKKSGKEKASDIPSWAEGQRPNPGESGKDFAGRLLDQKYGPGNWKKGPNTEHNKLKKYGDRNKTKNE